MNIEKQLHILQQVKAGTSLRERIRAKTLDLPSEHVGFSFPFVTVRWGFALVCILLFAIGGGIIAGAYTVRPGGSFYSIHVALDHVIHPSEVPVVSSIKMEEKFPTSIPIQKKPTPTLIQSGPTPGISITKTTPPAHSTQSTIQVGQNHVTTPAVHSVGQDRHSSLQKTFERIRTFFEGKFRNRNTSSSQNKK